MSFRVACLPRKREDIASIMKKGPSMAINPPVDATKTPEWAALQKHYDELQNEGISL